MTELEQKLLDELESLERARSEEREAFEQSIRSLSGRVAQEITEMMRTVSENSFGNEIESMQLLKTIVDQQLQIIRLLEKPPSSDNLSEALDRALGKLSRELSASLEASNERLIGELSQLFK